MRPTAPALAALCSLALTATARTAEPELALPERWDVSPPLLGPEDRAEDRSHAQKDPTFVFHEGKWHLFMTVKLEGRSIIEYAAFEDWEDAHAAPRTLLDICDTKYFCAPQVFYFAPHRLWYLIYQVGGKPDTDKMWVAYSTTPDIADPDSWTQAKPMLDGGPDDPREVGGLDYWIICDDARAHLFITSNNGKMWRLSTALADFPRGFAEPELALQAKIFEASHTYRIKGQDRYLTVIEENGRRFYKAYVADRLDGEWRPLADTEAEPFAGAANIRFPDGVPAWTDNISHGELVRSSNDQRLEIDPADLRFVFQGMLNKDKAGKGYGAWPWRLGMLTPAE